MDAAARRGAERERLRGRESQAKTADGQIELSARRLIESGCLRKKAGISISSIPAEAIPSFVEADCVRLVRHTMGVLRRE